MYRGAGFQQQSYASRQESWSSANGYQHSNVTGWPMTTPGPCIATPQLPIHPMPIHGGYGPGFAQPQGSNWGGNNSLGSGGLGGYGFGQQQGGGNWCGNNSQGSGGLMLPYGRDTSQFSQGGKPNNFGAGHGFGTFQTNSTVAGGGGGGGGGGYGTCYGYNAPGSGGPMPPYGHDASQFPLGKLINIPVSDGFGTCQTNAAAAGGGYGGGGYGFDGNMLDNTKMQETGYGYNSGWGNNESQSQHCQSNTTNYGLPKPYWATKGI